jgi:hypothetical protein
MVEGDDVCRHTSKGEPNRIVMGAVANVNAMTSVWLHRNRRGKNKSYLRAAYGVTTGHRAVNVDTGPAVSADANDARGAARGKADRIACHG